MTFPGFLEDISNKITIPDLFFRQVLFEIDDLVELKLTMYIFWRFDRMEGPVLVEAIQRGEWRMTESTRQPIDIYSEHPNIFQLYEANVGPLTPMIADALRDAEKTYQADWIEDAFRIAVERNKRNWRYIDAILHRWQEGGRDDRKEQQARRDTEEAIRKYGEWEK